MILLLAACGGGGDTGSALLPPADVMAGFSVGDEIVAAVGATAVAGDWADADDPGAVVELRLGANLPRHVVLPGDVEQTVLVSLGAWDGGELVAGVVEGRASFALALRVDAEAVDVPVVCVPDWDNDVPIVVYEQDGLWTWVFTDEDGGTGLLPTLLVATWGRPVDIEGLYDAGAAQIQTTDHAWVGFDGPWEGEHALLEVVTTNGMLGPYEDEPWCLSTLPIDAPEDGVPRERVLDDRGWLLGASWAEATREGWVTEDGGHDDRDLGAPDEYLFVDHDTTGGVKIAFEAEVGGAWWSSVNGLSTSEGLTDARLGGGVGRTAIELPPGAGVADVTGVRVYAYEGDGVVNSARWFGLDAAFAPVELGDAEGVAFSAGEGAGL